MKAILFDMDGTICDTLPMCMKAFKQALEPLIKRELSDEDITETFGPTEEGTVMALCPNDYNKGLISYWKYYQELHYMCPKPFDGIVEILDYLKSKDVLLGMITGKGKESCDISLDYFGIENYFDVVKTGSPEKSMKAEHMKEILNDYSLSKDEVIYIGDTVGDIIACRNAGIKILSVLWGSITEKEEVKKNKPDEVFYNVNELKSYIYNMFGDDTAKEIK